MDASRTDIYRAHPQVRFTGDDRGELDQKDGPPLTFRIFTDAERVRGVVLSDVQWLSHARFSHYRDEMARLRIR